MLNDLKFGNSIYLALVDIFCRAVDITATEFPLSSDITVRYTDDFQTEDIKQIPEPGPTDFYGLGSPFDPSLKITDIPAHGRENVVKMMKHMMPKNVING